MRAHLLAAAFLTTSLLAAACMGQSRATPAPSSSPKAVLGSFEASGARIGMSLSLALEAISSTKPAWAASISAQAVQAGADCAQGRGVLILPGIDGRAAAAIDARCEPDATGKNPMVREILIKARLSPSLSVGEVRQALSSRYGPASADRADAGGGFEMVWLAPSSIDPSAPQSETLTASLEAHGIESTPTALTLRLSSIPSRSNATSGAKPSALESLPF